MLKEESRAFARGDGDIGCARDFELEINVVDDKPVQRVVHITPYPNSCTVRSKNTYKT